MVLPHGPCVRASFTLAALLSGTVTSAANPQDARVPPDLSTYAAIDAALEHELLVPPRISGPTCTFARWSMAEREPRGAGRAIGSSREPVSGGENVM